MNIMSTLLLALWLWDAPACGDIPVAYRVEWTRRTPAAYIDAIDDDGNLIWLPVYGAWATSFVQEDARLSAEIPCEPATGEACVTIVTSVDEAGNVDDGSDCS